MNGIPVLVRGLGIASLLYFAVICLYCGFLPSFGWFWLLLGCLMFGWHHLLGFLSQVKPELYSLCLKISLVFLAAGMGIFLFSFLNLFFYGNRQVKNGADYLIVLGAKVNGCVPSKALRGRIETACTYLEQNPDAKAILTGGKGRGEQISEAACMEKELIEMGIEKSRLKKEEKSTTTKENIAFARLLMEDQNCSILIVTSDFHVKRGVSMAKEAGFPRVEALGSRSDFVMWLHYYTREMFSWVKYRTGVEK